MSELQEIFALHLERYPQMQPQDCVKLLYQNEFGPGHSITNENEALEWLKQEKELLIPNEEELFLPIGNYLYRVDLFQALKQYSLEQINTWFTQTANEQRGSLASYMKKLKEMKTIVASLPFSFSQEEYDSYIAYYRGAAYPAVHHSEKYQSTYNPHYRVVRKNIWNQ